MKTTANYGLKKPEGTDVVNIDDFNENADIIDTQIKSLNDKRIDYGTASGTNTYTVTIPGATLTEGRSYKIKFTNANTGAATLNINGLGAKSIVKSNGNALSSGNIKAGQILHLVYTGSVFQLLGEGGEYGTATADKVLTGYTIGTENGIVSGTMPNNSGKTQEAVATYSEEGFVRLRPPKGYYDGAQGSSVDWTDENFKKENIKPGVTIFGQTGTFTSDATATASQILSGQTAYVKGNKITGTMPNNGAKIITPSTTNQAIPAGYHNGSGYVKGDANLKPENIKNGVSIFGVLGSLIEGRRWAKGTITPIQNATVSLGTLSFIPTIILLKFTQWVISDNYIFISDSEDTLINFANGQNVAEGTQLKCINGGAYSPKYATTGLNPSITFGSFPYHNDVPPEDCLWIAIE